MNGSDNKLIKYILRRVKIKKTQKKNVSTKQVY